MLFAKLNKLKPRDKVAILSPSFAAPGMWPHVYELGLTRLREVFGLDPVEFPTTKKLGASGDERARDLIGAYEDRSIKAVIASLGGNDQITYVKALPTKPFVENPKPFFGYSDNTHFINHLWLNGIPAYYGGSLFTEFAMNVEMDPFTVKYLRAALFEGGRVKLDASATFSDSGLDWSDPANLQIRRRHQENEGWFWDGEASATGITWGGCVESIDELLRHGVAIPSLADFEKIVLLLETSEELPSADYVFRVLRALGERGIIERIRGVLIGRPKAWEFSKPLNDAEKIAYKSEQRAAVIRGLRAYNSNTPIVQNLDFGHTAPQICLPTGREIEIDAQNRTLAVDF